MATTELAATKGSSYAGSMDRIANLTVLMHNLEKTHSIGKYAAYNLDRLLDTSLKYYEGKNAKKCASTLDVVQKSMGKSIGELERVPIEECTVKISIPIRSTISNLGKRLLPVFATDTAINLPENIAIRE